MSDFYDRYIKNVKDLEDTIPNLDVKNTPQHLLYLKAAVCHKVEDAERFTFTENGQHGFTELLVNALMYHAYEAGRRSFPDDQKYQDSFNAGRKSAIKQVAELFELSDYDDDDDF